MTIPTGAEVFRNYNLDGVPASGAHPVDKREARALFTFYETLLNGTSGAGIAFATRALLNADLLHDAHTLAIVYDDTTPAYNGQYVKSGGSGSGSWARIGDLPNGIVRLTVTGGTAGAIVATAPETPSVPGNKLYLLTPTASNPGATTISVNGGAFVSIKNNAGSTLAPNSLVNGSPVAMLWSVDHYQLLVSIAVDTAGVVADAVAARDAAEDFKDAAEAAAAALGNQVHQYDTRTLAAGATIPGGVNLIRTFGTTVAGDGGGAVYKRGTVSGPGAFLGTGAQYWEWANPAISADLSYRQSETGAVAVPMIRRLNNTLFASEFGAVGDNVTNDRVALQAWLDAVAISHKEGRLDSGKNYYVSGGDLTLLTKVGGGNLSLYGSGSMLRTNPAEARTGLVIDNDFTGATRVDDGKIILIDGWTINHYQNANALWGIRVVGLGGNLVLRNNHFAGGADNGTPAYVNYGAIHIEQGTTSNPDTGWFWSEIENNRFKGGADQMPNAIWLTGAINATSISKNNFANVDLAIRLQAADAGGSTPNDGYVANGVKVLDNSFEGIKDGIKFSGLSGQSRSVGLFIAYNRIESVQVGGAAFFNYNLDVASEAPPVLGPNYVSSGDWTKYLANPNALNIDIRDEHVARTTINPGSLAANATATLGTVTVAPAVVGDHVTVETAGDLQGAVVSGYVSSLNTVTLRLTNPTSGAIDLPSLKWVVRVRPQF